MPIGVPRIIYCWGEELPAQWTDIYNFIFRRRMVFLMQYLDDELCNQICGLLINIHMEDRSKELEKKEIERSGLFKSGSKQQKSTDVGRSPDGSSTSSLLQQNKKNNSGLRSSSSFEDLLAADEDLGVDENNTLEQYTLQKITMEWLNWNAQFFDYSDEPYLFYLAEMLSKDFNKGDARMLYSTNENFSVSGSKRPYLQAQKQTKLNRDDNTRKSHLDIYSPFRLLANFDAQDFDLKEINPLAYSYFNSLKSPYNNKGESGGPDLNKSDKEKIDNSSNLLKGALFNNKETKLPAKQEIFQLFHRTLQKKAGQSNNMSKLLTELAQKNWDKKTNSQDSLLKSSEKALSQRRLRKEYIQNKNLNSTRSLKNTVWNRETGITNKVGQRPPLTTLNYLDFYSYNNTYTDFRNPPKKIVGGRSSQTERALQEEEAKKVFVIINSFGGSVGNGITVHDALQFIKAGSLTLALGVAASAASLALAGGTIGERYVTEGCHVMLHQPECLTPDHEVLTSIGFLPIEQVTLEHNIAVLLPNGELGYQPPTKVHKYEYDGNMYCIKAPNIDLKVTPEHNMFVAIENLSPGEARGGLSRNDNFLSYSLHNSSTLLNKTVRYKKNVDWNIPNYKFILPAVNILKVGPSSYNVEAQSTPLPKKSNEAPERLQGSLSFKTPGVFENLNPAKQDLKSFYAQPEFLKPEKELPMEDWLRFFGLWIAKGFCSRFDSGGHIVYITHVKPDVCLIIEKTLTNLGYNWRHHQKNYEVTNKQLWSYLNSLNAAALHKRLPNWVWELSRDQCKILLEGLILGDGHINKNDGSRHYLTGSLELAKDVCRLILHAGFTYSYSIEDLESHKSQKIKDQTINVNNPIYRVNVLTEFEPYANYESQKKSQVASGSYGATPLQDFSDETILKKHNDWFEPYKGPVYCLTVPNNVFYVQRNGQGVWTGNSSIQGQASDIWIDSQEILKIKYDVAEIYSLATYRPKYKILRDLDRDFYLTATETINYGLADEIATNEVMTSIIEMTNKVWDYHDSKQQNLLEKHDTTNSGADTQSQN